MPSSVGLEAMNSYSTKPELNWKIVTKGRRSRKSVARSFNGVAKVGNSTSPKRVGDFSGSDSDKIGEVVPGPTSRRSESVPIRKMRHTLRSTSAHHCTPSLRRQVSVSLQTCSPVFEDQEQLLYSRGHSVGQRLSKRKLHRIGEAAKVGHGDGFYGCYQTKHDYNDAGDFSGIELLAAAATMYFDDNANKNDLPKDSIMPKDSDLSGSATLSKVCLKMNEQENSSSDMTAQGGNTDCTPVLSNSAAASQTLFVSSKDVSMPKVSKHHWDLNTPMDAWEEPHDGNTTNDANIEENKLTAVPPDIVCSVGPSFVKHLGEPPSNPYLKDTGKNASERNTTGVSICDTQMDSYNQGTIKESALDCSPFIKLSCPSGLVMSTDTGLKMPNEDCSSNVKEFKSTSGSDRTRDVTAQDTLTSKTFESPFHVQCKDNKDSCTTSELPGSFTQDGQLELIAVTWIQNGGNCLSCSTITDSQGHLGAAAIVAKHEDNSLAIGSTTNVTDSKSFSDAAHCEDPTASVGKFGPPNSCVSQNNHSKMVDGNNLSGFHQDAYDSPYEDGELRDSFMYSWEDIEIENELVDYESDGRNGDGSDAADYPVSGIAGGGLEGSLRACVNNEIAEKVSYAKSGPTVEKRSMELLIDGSDGFMKRSQLNGRRELIQGHEYTPKVAEGKLYSRMEGWSSMDATDGKDAFFTHQFRYRSTTHSKREGERDGARQFKSWGPRRHIDNNNNTSSNQGSENRIHTRPRSKIRDQRADRTRGRESHHKPRPTVNYPPKCLLNRPFTRKSPSVVTSGIYFAHSRRIPLAHATGSYRGRGHYSQRGGMSRYFRDEWEFGPLADDDDDDGVGLPPVRLPCYISKRERSFSPMVSCRNPHMPLLPPRRVSRSRSRTRSPRANWHSRKEKSQPRVWGNRRYNDRSRSPNLRSEDRLDRMMAMSPLRKPDYGDGGYMSPHRNNFGDNCLRRRSPVRVVRRGGNQRFDGKRFADESFRPAMRSRISSFSGGGGVAHKAQRINGGGRVWHYRHSRGVGDVEAMEINNNNKEDDIPKNDAPPQALGDVEEDKRAAEI